MAVDGVTYTAGDGNLVDNTDGTWTLAIPAANALIENIYDVAVNVSDIAGNSSMDFTTLELTIDLTPPPAPGVTSMGSQFGTPVITGTWPSTPDTTLSVTVNGVIYTEGDGNLSANADGTWSLAIPTANALLDGLYEVVATLTDLAGNQSGDPGVDELLIDTIAPIPPGVTSLTTNSGAPLLTGTAIVQPGDLFTILVNGVLYTSGDNQLAVAADNTWSLQIPPQHAMAEGPYDITAVVSDAVGNTSTDPSSGELLIDMTAPDLATVVSQLTNVTTPVITGLANPGSGEILTVTVNGVTYTAGDGVLINNGDGTWQLSLLQPLTDGSYDIMVSVTDTAGNSTDSIGTLLIDTMDPAIDVDAIADDKTVTPPLTGITDQPDGSIVAIFNTDGETVCTAIVQSNTWQCEPDIPLDYGLNSLLASVTDSAGNVTQLNFDVAVDTDFDGDGIDNSDEGTGDLDGDGIADLYDLDTDNDGIPDAVEENKDTDNDGIPDYRDRDADNDGIADVVEAGASDQDLNFILDRLADTDTNGLADFVQTTPLPITDTDFDGIPDYLDVDSDQDGIPDLLELGGTDEDNDGRIDNAVDDNNDGIDDAVLILPFTILFSDNDNTADHLDTDSDQDGTFDLVEAGGSDLDNDGIVDSMLDLDQDGIPDSVDVTYTLGDDFDRDGIDDRMDASQLALLSDSAAATVSGVIANDATNTLFDDAIAIIDTDGDDIPDQFDPDANGDGYADDVILSLALGMALPDGDDNGTPDFQQAGNFLVHTGLQGHAGCSVTGRSGKDPLLPLLFIIAFAGAMRRYAMSV